MQYYNKILVLITPEYTQRLGYLELKIVMAASVVLVGIVRI